MFSDRFAHELNRARGQDVAGTLRRDKGERVGDGFANVSRLPDAWVIVSVFPTTVGFDQRDPKSSPSGGL